MTNAHDKCQFVADKSPSEVAPHHRDRRLVFGSLVGCIMAPRDVQVFIRGTRKCHIIKEKGLCRNDEVKDPDMGR